MTSNKKGLRKTSRDDLAETTEETENKKDDLDSLRTCEISRDFETTVIWICLREIYKS